MMFTTDLMMVFDVLQGMASPGGKSYRVGERRGGGGGTTPRSQGPNGEGRGVVVDMSENYGGGDGVVNQEEEGMEGGGGGGDGSYSSPPTLLSSFNNRLDESRLSSSSGEGTSSSFTSSTGFHEGYWRHKYMGDDPLLLPRSSPSYASRRSGTSTSSSAYLYPHYPRLNPTKSRVKATY